MSDEERAEQRHNPRIAQPFIVRYRLQGDAQPDWSVSTLRDLSSGGARFFVDRPIAVGAIVELQLRLPVSQQPIALTARVAWIRPGKLGAMEIGITFDPGDAAIQRLIDVSVEHFLKRGRS